MTFDFSNTVSNILKKSKHNFLGIPRFKRLSSIPIIVSGQISTIFCKKSVKVDRLYFKFLKHLAFELFTRFR